MRILLSVLYEVASNVSLTELQQNAYFNVDKYANNVIMKQNIDRIFESDSVSLANKIYVRNGSELNESFKQIVGDYKSEIEQVDFNQTVEVTDEINDWVAERTNGLIQNLVEKSSITSDTELFLVNALYFKGYWADPFGKDSITNQSFTFSDKTVHSIHFMSRYGGYRQGHNDDLKLFTIELPYKPGSNFVFWIILPHESSSIEEVKDSLTGDVILNLNSKLVPRRVILNLPIFEIETVVDAKEILRELGMNEIFNAGVLNLLKNSNQLKIDQVKQKNRISVNTEGTEAASASCMLKK